MNFYFRTTESTRLRESTVRKSLEQRTANEQDEIKQEQRRRRRQKLLKPEVTRKVMANDHSGQLKKAAKEKVQNFRYERKSTDFLYRFCFVLFCFWLVWFKFVAFLMRIADTVLRLHSPCPEDFHNERSMEPLR